MSSVRELLYEAMRTQDWAKVEEATLVLFGTENTSQEDLLLRLKDLLIQTPQTLTKSKLNTKKKTVKNSIKASDLEDENTVPVVRIADVKPRTTGSDSPTNKDPHKPFMPFANAYNEREVELNKEHINLDKVSRDPYVPKIVKCDRCTKEFDYKKEYPAGSTSFRSREDGDKPLILCPKCKNK